MAYTVGIPADSNDSATLTLTLNKGNYFFENAAVGRNLLLLTTPAKFNNPTSSDKTSDRSFWALIRLIARQIRLRHFSTIQYDPPVTQSAIDSADSFQNTATNGSNRLFNTKARIL